MLPSTGRYSGAGKREPCQAAFPAWRVFSYSTGGISGKPRTVNNLAIAALIATYAAGKKIVDQSAARAAISEVISTE